MHFIYEGKTYSMTVVDSLLFARDKGVHKLWKLILNDSLCFEFLTNEPPSQVFSVAKQINNWRVWKIVLERKDVIEFLD